MLIEIQFGHDNQLTEMPDRFSFKDLSNKIARMYGFTTPFRVQYKDEEGDWINLTSEGEMELALQSGKQNCDILPLNVVNDSLSACPMCDQKYSLKEIEAHVNNCLASRTASSPQNPSTKTCPVCSIALGVDAVQHVDMCLMKNFVKEGLSHSILIDVQGALAGKKPTMPALSPAPVAPVTPALPPSKAPVTPALPSPQKPIRQPSPVPAVKSSPPKSQPSAPVGYDPVDPPKNRRRRTRKRGDKSAIVTDFVIYCPHEGQQTGPSLNAQRQLIQLLNKHSVPSTAITLVSVHDLSLRAHLNHMVDGVMPLPHAFRGMRRLGTVSELQVLEDQGKLGAFLHAEDVPEVPQATTATSSQPVPVSSQASSAAPQASLEPSLAVDDDDADAEEANETFVAVGGVEVDRWMCASVWMDKNFAEDPLPSRDGSGVKNRFANGDVDIEVVRTNWWYRQQPRILRFTKSDFRRLYTTDSTADVDPSLVREVFAYSDVSSIDQTSETSLVINFVENKHKPEYISSKDTAVIANLILSHNGGVTIKKTY